MGYQIWIRSKGETRTKKVTLGSRLPAFGLMGKETVNNIKTHWTKGQGLLPGFLWLLSPPDISVHYHRRHLFIAFLIRVCQFFNIENSSLLIGWHCPPCSIIKILCLSPTRYHHLIRKSKHCRQSPLHLEHLHWRTKLKTSTNS